MTRLRLIGILAMKELREHLLLALGLVGLWSVADRWPLWMYLTVMGIGYQLMVHDVRQGFLPYLFTKPVPRPILMLAKLGTGAVVAAGSLGLNALIRYGVYQAAYAFPSVRWMLYLVGPRLETGEAVSLLSRAMFWLAVGALAFAWRPNRWTWVWAPLYAYALWGLAVWPLGVTPRAEPWVLIGLAAACGAGAVAEGVVHEP